MTKPKLTLIPAAFGTKLYSVLPAKSDSDYTDGVGDFTFTRASSATRIPRTGYIETVTSGKSRLNYQLNTDGTVQECPHYLLEPARTNFFIYSEGFNNSFWSTSNINTPYIADVISPTGELNTSTLEVSNGQTNGGGLYKVGLSIIGAHSFSIFAKKKNTKYLVLADSGTLSTAVYFDLENGVVGTTYNATGEIQDFGNGWYRCTMKYSITSSGFKYIYMSNIDGTTIGGTQGGDSIYIFGAQFEQSSFATSYIPTNGIAVTRAAETATDSGNSQLFNNSEGLLYIESKAFDNTIALNRKIVLGDGTLSNGVEFSYQTSTNKMQFIIRSGGSISMGIETSAFDVTEFTKIAIQYKLNEGKVFVNGNQIGATYTNIVSPTINRLDLKFGNGFNFEGKVKEIRVYDEALTDEELASLTTI